IHRRRSDIAALTRRIGTDLDGVLLFAQRARERIAADDAWDDNLAALRGQVETLHEELLKVSTRVAEGRRDAAVALGASVNAELAGLAMPDADFAVDVSDVDLGPHGATAVTMTLAAHP